MVVAPNTAAAAGPATTTECTTATTTTTTISLAGGGGGGIIDYDEGVGAGCVVGWVRKVTLGALSTYVVCR